MNFYTPFTQQTPKKQLAPDFTIEEGMQENILHCILHIRRVTTLHEGMRWPDIKRYGIMIYRRNMAINVSPTKCRRTTCAVPSRFRET